jgi:hypothetical protein
VSEKRFGPEFVKEQPKPCGNYHPLPCGLDVDCKVPPKYYEDDLSDKEVWKKYKNDN